MTAEIKGVSPHADFYPMLSDEALSELAEDIKANGQRDPITVNRAGVLLDGRNRLKACQLIDVEPVIEVYEGKDDGAFVRSRNERRHQATGSRAMSTALSLVEDDLRIDGRWKRGSLDSGKSPDSNENWLSHIRRAGTVLDYAADLAEEVVGGKVALDAAYRQAKAEKDRLENAERRKVEAAQAEEEREAYAADYFANHPAAQEWLNSKPEGVFETARSAFAAYQEHDREARAAEEERRREEEQRQREHLDSLKRDANRLKGFLTGYGQAWGMREHPHRDHVLNMLEPTERKRFITIEGEITWPETKH